MDIFCSFIIVVTLFWISAIIASKEHKGHSDFFFLFLTISTTMVSIVSLYIMISP